MAEPRKEFTIFLVDDDLMYLKTLEHHLKQHLKAKIKIYSYQTGESCFENLNLEPDIIILDYFLDGENEQAMNGIETLKRIRQANSNIQVMMLSGQENIDIAINTIENGAFDYVIKNESAFLRTTNIINNIIYSIQSKQMIKKYELYFKYVALAIIALVIIFFIISRIIAK